MLPMPDAEPQSPPEGLKALAYAADAQDTAAALPVIQRHMAAMIQSTITRATLAYNQNQLTPEMALQAFADIAAFQRLLRRFNQIANMGAGVAAQSPAAQTETSDA